MFVGKVTQETGTDYKNETPIEQEDDSIKYIGEAYTNYKVEVISNLKNELAMDKEIVLQKQGGIREDGSAYDVFEDDQLPEVGNIYIFTAYTQDDGSLLVAGEFQLFLSMKKPKIDTEKEASKTEEFELYEEAVENQVTPEEN